MRITPISLLLRLMGAPILCQETLNLGRDGVISGTFSEREIEGLESMVRYVENMVTNGKTGQDIDMAYHQFFERIAKSTEYNAPFDETEKYRFLKSLDSVQSSAVWRFDTYINMLTVRDTVYRNLDNFPQLDIKPFSKYMDHVEEVGKENPYFRGLRSTFKAVDGFSAGDAAWFPKY